MPREMKDSGIEWIREIPSHWLVCHFWNIASIYNGNSIKDDEKINYEDPINAIPYIATKDVDATFQTIEYGNGMYIKKDDCAFKKAPKSSVLLCIEGGSAGKKIAFTNQEVAFINKLCCFHSNVIDNKYMFYYMLSSAFTEKFYSHISGLIGGVSISEIKSFPITIPTIVEQKAIADFLDRRCAEIDAVIEQTKATIEEYKKLKQSVITEAVTKGIRGDRPMKDSGIEWIGEIPREWDVVRKLSYRCMSSISYGIVKLLEPDDENGVKVLRCSDVYEGGISLDNVRTVSQEVSNEYRRTLLTGGEIIIAVRGSLGGCAVVPTELSGYNVAREIAVIPLDANLTNNKYAMYYLLSDAFIKYRDSHLLGSVYVGLNIELLSACPLIEPSLKEQREIADYLDQKCAEIDTLIEKKTALLAEMENYKKSLIFEYVTGKKEVASEIAHAVTVVYPYFPSVLATNKLRFAQAVLMSKILDSNVSNMGRVKLEKMLFTIEHSLGFDFDTEYHREAAGPLDSSIYECERVVSQRNKWFYVNSSDYGVSYKARKDMSKYKKYYEQYFSDYNEEIERIITIFRNYSLDQAEIVATLYGAWNDFVIDKKKFTDEDVVDDVLNNWNDSKKRFSKDVWLRAMQTMKNNNLVPKGYGKRTVGKEDM